MMIAFNALPLLWPQCGTRTYVENLIPQIIQRNIGVELIADRSLSEYMKNCSTNVTGRPIRSLKSKMLWETLAFKGASRKSGARLCHVPYMGLPAIGTVDVATIHDAIPWEADDQRRTLGERIYFGAQALAARRCRAVITVSQYSKRRIIEVIKVDPKRIHVIPIAQSSDFTAVNPDEMQCLSTGGLPEKPYLLYVGGTNKHKNLVRLVKAYCRLPARLRSAYDLVLIGPLVPTSSIHQPVLDEINQFSRPGQIVRIPRLDFKMLHRAYVGATAFVYPSLNEGFGLPPLEAMACGVPVLTSNVSSIPEVVGDCALMFDPEDVEQITHQLTVVLESSQLRAQLSEKGLQRARLFTWAKTADATLKVYQGLLDS